MAGQKCSSTQIHTKARRCSDAKKTIPSTSGIEAVVLGIGDKAFRRQASSSREELSPIFVDGMIGQAATVVG